MRLKQTALLFRIVLFFDCPLYDRALVSFNQDLYYVQFVMHAVVRDVRPGSLPWENLLRGPPRLLDSTIRDLGTGTRLHST